MSSYTAHQDAHHASVASRIAPPGASNTTLQSSIAYAAIVDPHDETIETEITEEMISLALEAVENEQIWPFCGAVPMVASAPRPSADIIRFPGC